MSDVAPTVAARRARRRPKMFASVGLTVVATVAIITASVGVAVANAADPVADAAGTAVATGAVIANGDGSFTVVTGDVSVDVGGTWDWSTQRSCTTRYGVAWAVDWSGLSTDSSPVPSLSINGTGLFFHVGTTMDGVYAFTDPCAEANADGSPTGPWTATHTYPAGSTIPAALCVNMYDVHRTSFGSPIARDLDPSLNGDNSVRTNAFNPTAAAGYCATVAVTGTGTVAPVVEQQTAVLSDIDDYIASFLPAATFARLAVQAVAPALPARILNKLVQARDSLIESLDPSFFTDANHLNAQTGKRFFDLQRKTLERLRDVLQDKNSVIPASIVQGWISVIADGDMLLAQIALNEANLPTASEQRAEDEMAHAAAERAKGHDAEAINHYKHAWELATRVG